MLLAVLIVVALVAVCRFFLVRYTGDPVFASVAPAAVVAALLLGRLAAPLFFPGDSAPAVTTAAAAGGTQAAVRNVSSACPRDGRSTQADAPGSLDQFVRAADGAPVPNGGALMRGDQHTMLGWAADPHLDRPAVAVCLAVDGRVEPRAVSYYFYARRDVADHYGQPALATTGYALQIPAGVLAPGSHHLDVLAALGDRSLALVHGSSRTVEVR